MRVDPGDLYDTDSLMLKGLSGTTHTVWNRFGELKAGVRYTITSDLTDNFDVMDQLRNGSLEGVIQDDSAVFGVKIFFLV